MSTIKQKTAISKTLENIGNNTPEPTGKVMFESGYSKASAKNPKILTDSNAYKEALDKINYTRHLNTLDKMAGIKNEDKDNRLRAIKMLMDLGNKFPDKDTKVIASFGQWKRKEENEEEQENESSV